MNPKKSERIRDSGKVRKKPRKYQTIWKNSKKSEWIRQNPIIIPEKPIESEIIRKELNKFRNNVRKLEKVQENSESLCGSERIRENMVKIREILGEAERIPKQWEFKRIQSISDRIGENPEESERNGDNPKIIRGNLIESDKEPNKFRKNRRKTRENSKECYEIPGET